MCASVSQWEKWLIAELPSNGDIALDIGAHTGEWTVDLAKVFREVICFEPNPQTYHELWCKMLDYPNVICLRLAISDSRGIKKLFLFKTDTHASFYETLFTRQDESRGAIDVDCVTLDTCPFKGHVDFVKIDVEGSEVDVLNGGLELLRHNKPQLLIEIHSSENGKKVLWILDNLGYDVPITIHSPRDRVESEFWREHFWISS